MHNIQTRLAATRTQMPHRRSVHTTRPRLPMPPDPAMHDLPPISRHAQIANHASGLRATVLLPSASLSASVAQLAEHALRKRMVMGSIPIRGWCTRYTIYCVYGACTCTRVRRCIDLMDVQSQAMPLPSWHARAQWCCRRGTHNT